MSTNSLYHLRVFPDRSILFVSEDKHQVFEEGTPSREAKGRQEKIAGELRSGFLCNRIKRLREHSTESLFDELDQDSRDLISSLVQSVTSEVGRAIVGLTVLQLCVKCIAPHQSIRLHKGGARSSEFSWKEGISMRSLDKRFITPTLRAFDLLKLNADGFMMTRSLAENYPYSMVYKAAIRGNRTSWLELVERIEEGTLDASKGLDFLLSRLISANDQFNALAASTLDEVERLVINDRVNSIDAAIEFLTEHLSNSTNPPRLMEVAMHSLLQVFSLDGDLGPLDLKALSQMRSANKKHGNVGDVELLLDGEIIGAWDAKYGKTYLRDELEELDDKLGGKNSLERVGFVLSTEPEDHPEVTQRILELEEKWGITISLQSFSAWVNERVSEYASDKPEGAVAAKWIRTYARSLALKNADIAPIDEPTGGWLESLRKTINP